MLQKKKKKKQGRPDAARLAQSQVGQNQNQTAAAPSGSSSTGGGVMPIRRSEKKDEGCVFSLSSLWLVCAVCPECLSTAETVRQLLRGSLSQTRVRSRSPQMFRRASRFFSSYFPYLATHPR